MSDFSPDFSASRRTTLRMALHTALGAGGALLAKPGIAQADWPKRAVTIVVGAPPGGQTDFAARSLIAGMQGALGQPVVVDNKAGVTGNIAAGHVHKDGLKNLLREAAQEVFQTILKLWGPIVQSNNIRAD